MPQVFGAEELELVKTASLWVEADFLGDVEKHENALAGAGFDSETLPVNLDRSVLHPRGQVWGQHLRSDGTHHYYAVAHVANPEVDPNARETSVGGAKSRYSVEVHAVPKNPQGRAKGVVTPVWHGNDVTKFLGGVRRSPDDMTWPDIQRTMKKGPRG